MWRYQNLQIHQKYYGRVKTLHPKIHEGILYKRKNKLHELQIKKNNLENIDLVVVTSI